MSDMLNKIVWWVDPYHNLNSGRITEITKRNDTEYAIIHAGHFGGIQTGAKLSDCYESKQACIDAEKEKSRIRVEQYMNQINTVQDLVKFLFDHDVVSEYKDYDAEKAAKIKALNLLKLDLDD
jgi:phosphoribosylpyrophosphate synthetase